MADEYDMMTNKDEWWEWFKRFRVAYPEAQVFARASKDPKATVRGWCYAMLTKCTIQDADTVTANMVAGAMAAVPFKDWSNLPTHVLTHCRTLAGRRLTAQRQAEAPPTSLVDVQKPDEWEGSSLQIMNAMTEAIKNGEDHHVLGRKLIPPKDDDPRDHKACPDCQDVGLVDIWHRDCTLLAAQHKLVAGKSMCKAAIRCHCKAGNQYEGLSRGGWDKSANSYRWEKSVIYNYEKYRKCRGFTELDVFDLQCWMDHRKPAGHVAAFDDFNKSDQF